MPDLTERRRARRQCQIAVAVYSDGIRQACSVSDISEHGCQLKGPVFSLGNEVEVHFDEPRMAVPGRVAWKTYDRAGVEFQATIGVGSG